MRFEDGRDTQTLQSQSRHGASSQYSRSQMQSSARFAQTGSSVNHSALPRDQDATYLEGTSHLHMAQSKLEEAAPPSSTFVKNDCNMIAWGSWKDIYDAPIQLNFMLETPDGVSKPLQSCVVEMVCIQDCCHFITEDGGLYSMGSSMKGLLGLGRVIVTTQSQAMRVQFPDDTQVVDIKAGSNHILVLTAEGQVYAWGMNNHGQVGIREHSEKQWEPVMVYPTQEQLNRHDQDETGLPEYDKARQILAYEDSSFIVTEGGALYSWGKNDNNFLGRETKIDLQLPSNSTGSASQADRLRFSNSIPTRVKKLERYNFSRIAIKDGKFMAFFLDDINPSSSSQQDEDDMPGGDQTHSKHNSTLKSEAKESSEFDSEEEKDVIADLSRLGGKKPSPKKKLNQSITSSTSSSAASSYSGSSRSSRSRGTGSSFRPKYSKEGSKLGRDAQRRYDIMVNSIRQACSLKEKLVRFDRMLADSMKPLLDCEGNDRGLYSNVIDKFVEGNQTVSDAEELRLAIDKIQIQFKINLASLDQLEKEIQTEVRESLKKQQDFLKEQQLFTIHDDAMFKELQVLQELLIDSLTLKKFNLVGCKMKIYQERMKELNFLELMDTLRARREEDDEAPLSEQSLQRQKELLKQAKILCRKTQHSLKKSADHYLQLHLGCTIPTSLALSTMTNGVYSLCDLWSGLSTLTQYTSVLQGQIGETQGSNDKIRKLWRIFEELQKTDFDKKVRQHEERADEYPSTNEMFEAITKEVHGEVKSVITQVRAQMKENQRRGDNQDILYFFQTLIHDAALTRQILFTTQHALFQRTNSDSQDFPKEDSSPEQIKGNTPTPGVNQRISTKGGDNRKSNLDDRKSNLDDRKSTSTIKTGKSAKNGGQSAKSVSMKEREPEITPQGGGLISGFLGMFGGGSAKK
ncbi:hypothetical protein FGO68_gene14540 [Halteria grandinella]|uniref:Uncharacterized protein n=1 Tax=Halteria grandinella TaxID=5974 RepID=A0A8J8T9F7_HALGN|nr:hypothetical protein FGO68_gene14540 [Halteria grandinella]